nr:lytic transglycosylase domain-containing protein [Lysinibacter cavernae]
MAFATLAAGALVGINLVGPYSGMVSQSQAFEVVPLKPSDAIYQVYTAEELAQGQEIAAIQADNFDLEMEPEPTPTPTPTPTEESKAKSSASAPAAGIPDPGTAQAIAITYVGPGAEFDCLVALWNKESHWNVFANNASSGAYGIPQALPGEKMASAGADWATNPDTQIRWGLGYIQGRYGTPCGAWGHSQSVGWY